VRLVLFGLTIHEADVALTDAALAVLGAWIAWRLWRHTARGPMHADGARINAALAAAALGGGLYHAFFPIVNGARGGRPLWIATTTAIALATAGMLTMALRLLAPSITQHVVISTALVAAFVGTIVFVDQTYRTVVLFYGPVLLLLLVAALREARRSRSRAWWMVAGGLVLSVVAAGLQQARVALHPVYVDHNALYHVVQALALIILYRGLRAV
jgi:hypothetical protein